MSDPVHLLQIFFTMQDIYLMYLSRFSCIYDFFYPVADDKPCSLTLSLIK